MADMINDGAPVESSPTASLRNIRIGDVLKEYGYVTEEQIVQALAYQREHKGMRLGGALIELGMISESNMLQALAQRLNMQMIDVSSRKVDLDATAKIPHQLAEKYCMLAIEESNGVLTVVVDDPMNFYAIEDIRQITGMQLQIGLCESEPLRKAISFFYNEVAAQEAARKANISASDNVVTEQIEELTVEEGDDDTPIINLLNSLLKRAYSVNASDVHIEPYEDKSMVRMRIDGAIIEYVNLQKSLHASLIARIKILSDLDIAERRVPQDGHFRVNIAGNYVNIRVSVIPTVFGEKAVLRLLASQSVIQNEESFGMTDEDYGRFRHMLDSPHGVIYMTGPTGSGKTTTLYMILEELSKRNVNIATIEDPVEKNLPKVNQMQVNNVAGLTFERGLRALLRQDPDIIMVGETRDAETAAISVRSAITGHLVFSTLHTNDATSSIIRLIDMGIEPYMVANSLVGIVAQRLMRKICPDCGEFVEANPEECDLLGVAEGTKIKKAHGCAQCNYTGYRGRIAIHEILEIDRPIRRLISEGATMEDIEQYAVKNQGMRLLRDCAVEQVLAGVTTIEELRRVAFYSDPKKHENQSTHPVVAPVPVEVLPPVATPTPTPEKAPDRSEAVAPANEAIAPASEVAAPANEAVSPANKTFAYVNGPVLDIEEIILDARGQNCSDVHITAGSQVQFRIFGKLEVIDRFRLSEAECSQMLLNMLDEKQRRTLFSGKDVDFAIQTRDGNRQRVNIYRDMGHLAATIRLLNNEIPTLESLGLPMTLQELADQPRGMILVTGPTGSGKSTTLAAMIDYVNTNRPEHIITIEDPVEYVYQAKKALIHQREVGRDVSNFADALRSALREDPDIILVGEMRDYETISAALTAAETGHLVMSTLHTTGAAQTIDRVIDACPASTQNQVRTQLAGVLKGVITQCLIPRIEGGRVAATEILTGTDAVLNMIRENKCHQLNTAMQAGAIHGMHTLNNDLMKLVRQHIISAESAMRYTNDKREMESLI